MLRHLSGSRARRFRTWSWIIWQIDIFVSIAWINDTMDLCSNRRLTHWWQRYWWDWYWKGSAKAFQTIGSSRRVNKCFLFNLFFSVFFFASGRHVQYSNVKCFFHCFCIYFDQNCIYDTVILSIYSEFLWTKLCFLKRNFSVFTKYVCFFLFTSNLIKVNEGFIHFGLDGRHKQILITKTDTALSMCSNNKWRCRVLHWGVRTFQSMCEMVHTFGFL